MKTAVLWDVVIRAIVSDEYTASIFRVYPELGRCLISK
jgi:hypothetical protein